MNSKKMIFINVVMVLPLLLFNCEAPGNPGHKNKTSQPEEQKTTEKTPKATGEKITDESLIKFAKISKKLQVAQTTMNEQIANVFEKRGVMAEEYHTATKKRKKDNGKKNTSPITPEEINEITKEIQAIRSETRQKYNTITESYGLTMRKYQQLSAAIRKDPTLQQRLKKLQKN